MITNIPLTETSPIEVGNYYLRRDENNDLRLERVDAEDRDALVKMFLSHRLYASPIVTLEHYSTPLEYDLFFDPATKESDIVSALTTNEPKESEVAPQH